MLEKDKVQRSQVQQISDKSTDSSDIYDITIIGGGPVGMFTAFYAGLRTAKTKIIESLDELGGQTNHLYADKAIHDVPAIPSISGRQLTKQLLDQAQAYSPTICTGETVKQILPPQAEENYFKLYTQTTCHLSRTVIIATGNGAFSPRKLTIDLPDSWENHYVHYYNHQLDQFKGQRVAITGGGDSALDWALSIEPLADTVYLIHRRPRFRAHEASVQALNQSRVQQFTPYLPKALIGQEEGKLTGIQIQKARSQDLITLDIDHLIVSYGFTSSLNHLKEWNLEIDRNAIKVNARMESSTPGIFALGDCAYYPGRTKLIATGFGEAPMAVNSALLFIDPNTNIAPIHSNH